MKNVTLRLLIGISVLIAADVTSVIGVSYRITFWSNSSIDHLVTEGRENIHNVTVSAFANIFGVSFAITIARIFRGSVGVPKGGNWLIVLNLAAFDTFADCLSLFGACRRDDLIIVLVDASLARAQST